MRFITKLSLAVVLLALVAGLTVGTPVAQAQSNTGLVTYYNQSGTPLTFSIDDVGYTCRIKFGSCNARAVVGGHTLYAKYDNGNVAAQQTINLTTGGFDWTIYEEK